MSALSRRQFVATSAMALALPAVFTRRASGAEPATGPEPVTVEIENGRLQGLRENGAVSFRGVPYAADTGGKNRFMAPRPVPNWTGVREAVRYGTRSPQGRGGSGRGGANPASSPEDCCVLNVFAPSGDLNARRPVMLYIHGGGFRSGNGDIDGGTLAKFGDAVVVSVNHRLSIFGYLHLGFLDPEFADAGNAGQLDLITALAWVKRNIRTFGGDPDRVTVFGQSGGGSKIVTLMLMPGAKGLFHRAINMSGSSGFGIGDAALREPLSNEFIKVIGVDKTNLRRLQEFTPEQLLAAHATAVANLGVDDYRPVVDGRLVAHGPLTPDGLAMQASVPVLASMTAHESTSFLTGSSNNPQVTADEVKARIKAQYKLDDAKAAAAMDGYRQHDPNRTPWDILVVASSEGLVRRPMQHHAELRARLTRTPIYLMDFNYRSTTADPVRGVVHGADIPFAFGRPTAEADAEVSRKHMAAFAAFARTGNPNDPSLPEWKPYDLTRRPTLVMDRPCRMVDDWRGADRKTSASLPFQTAVEALAGPLFRGIV